MTQAAFAMQTRNPDVLTCIANLSSDEVFTPPSLANEMLDSVAEAWAAANDGANIWEDSTVRFLDPFAKSGIFLREIATRLTEGLKYSIPSLSERVDHILTKQLFGIGITELTGLLTRRSLYCSKFANGAHSIAKSFATEDGNIWFQRTEHSWIGGAPTFYIDPTTGDEVEVFEGGRCRFCGAQRQMFERNSSLESHAYAFIHADDIEVRLNEIFGTEMKFDVVIGNPPYQMAGAAGGSSDSSIYQLFVDQARSLEPRLLSMVIPSRWLAGGRGLDTFRKSMLSSGKLVSLVDFPVSKDVFPGVEVKGGICYFVWDSAHDGRTAVTSVRDGSKSGPMSRKLDEFDVFVRDARAVEILRLVLEKGEESITSILTGDTPFGLATNFTEFQPSPRPNTVALHYVLKGKRSIGYVDRDKIKKNAHLIDRWKVLVPEAGSDGGQRLPDVVLGKPIVVEPESVCTQTFLAFWLSSESEAESLSSYSRSKFFRFMVSLRKITQHALRSTYTWVPVQSWDQQWEDEALYSKYGFSGDQILYIESVIKTMEA